MTPARARALISQPRSFGGGDHRNAVRQLLEEGQREHGQGTVADLIRDLDLARAFGREPGTAFTTVGRRHDQGAHRVRPIHLTHHQL